MNNHNNSMPLPPKGIYRHFKGGEYRLLHLARHSETDETMVVYQALYACGETPGGQGIWVRPLSMWNEQVLFNGSTVTRFTLVLPETEE